MLLSVCTVKRHTYRYCQKMEYISSKDIFERRYKIMKVVKKVISAVANLASESTSGIGFYEPKMPKELVKPEKKKGSR